MRRSSSLLVLTALVALAPWQPAVATATQLSPEAAADGLVVPAGEPATAAVGSAAAGPAEPEEPESESLPVAAAALLRSLPLPPPPPRVFAITPERRALLNTIRYAEGTWAGGEDVGYRIMFGGSLMPSLDRHPDRVIRSARYASAAAGAYQFMPFTWELVTRSMGFQPEGPEAFGPQVQDQGALFLIERRGALALADQGQFTPQLAHKLAPEWASFPTLAGRSFYGQPVKRFEDLRRFYEANLARLRDGIQPGIQPLSPEPSRPVCEPSDSLRCQLEAVDPQQAPSQS
ncbi:MAG: endolysin [Cyanobium sp.]